MTDPTDYSRLEPASAKDPTKYVTEERLADLLEHILDAGGPSRVNKSALADTYGVNRSTIYSDLDTLAERIGEDVITKTVAVHAKVLDALLDEGKWRSAWKTDGMVTVAR